MRTTLTLDLCGRRWVQVILVDVNILVYASNDDTEQHAAALQWLNRQLAGSAPVGLPWISLRVVSV
jgi:predicted nucleic acid-binding protein